MKEREERASLPTVVASIFSNFFFFSSVVLCSRIFRGESCPFPRFLFSPFSTESRALMLSGIREGEVSGDIAQSDETSARKKNEERFGTTALSHNFELVNRVAVFSFAFASNSHAHSRVGPLSLADERHGRLIRRILASVLVNGGCGARERGPENERGKNSGGLRGNCYFSGFRAAAVASDLSLLLLHHRRRAPPRRILTPTPPHSLSNHA